MEPNVALTQAMFFALAGWVATCYCIVHSRIKPQTRKWLIVPLWFLWMTLALGGPVYQGVVTAAAAASTGVSFSMGMMLVIFMRSTNRRKSR